jgi:hypothetical protein
MGKVMARGCSPRGPIGRISGIGAIEGPDVISRIRMIQRISAVDAALVQPPAIGRSFREILENKAWRTGRLPLPEPQRKVPERKPLPPTREELEEMLEAQGGGGSGSFLSRLVGALTSGAR